MWKGDSLKALADATFNEKDELSTIFDVPQKQSIKMD